MIKLEASFNSNQKSAVNWTDAQNPINIDIHQKYTSSICSYPPVLLCVMNNLPAKK